MFKLASDPRQPGLACLRDGLTLAGYPLLFDNGEGLSPRPATEIQDVLDAVYGADSGLAADNLMRGLASVARSLSKGDLPLAMIGSVLLRLPDVPNSRTFSKTLPERSAKFAYNQAELRDVNGRWTAGAGGGGPQAAVAHIRPGAANAALPVTPVFLPAVVEGAEVAAEVTEAAAPGLLARLGAGALGLLDSLAAVLGKPTRVGEFYLLPNELPDIQGGSIPDAPGLTYDSVDGFVTIFGRDASGKTIPVYQAKPDDHYFYHDDKGLIIGRYTGNAVLFDSEALQEIAEDKGVPAAPKPSARVLTQITEASDTDQPKFCPPPTPEDIKGRSERSLAYQSQITGLPEGWEIIFRDVRYDGCVESVKHLQEAKGIMGGYLEGLTDDELRDSWPYARIMRQAERQNAGASGYTVDWYFADERFYRVFTKDFNLKHFDNITTHHVEAVVKKIEEPLAYVRRHLFSDAPPGIDARLLRPPTEMIEGRPA
jgi:hypothetical protein